MGVDYSRRGKIADENLEFLLQLLKGEPGDVNGRRIQVTPSPVTDGGPRILIAGGSTAAAKRAARHGLGFIALCIVIWIACVKRQSPYTLLAATLTPVGPVGSVIGIELIERRGWGIAPGGSVRDPAQSATERT